MCQIDHSYIYIVLNSCWINELVLDNSIMTMTNFFLFFVNLVAKWIFFFNSNKLCLGFSTYTAITNKIYIIQIDLSTMSKYCQLCSYQGLGKDSGFQKYHYNWKFVVTRLMCGNLRDFSFFVLITNNMTPLYLTIEKGIPNPCGNIILPIERERG